MKRSHKILLALLSAILLTLPFYQWGTGLLLLVAFVPLLFIEEAIATQKASKEKEVPNKAAGTNHVRKTKSQVKKKRTGSVIWYGILTFMVFNIMTSWWVKHAAWVGIIASVVVGTLYMTLVLWLFHITRRRLGNRMGYISLVVYWLTFEFLYLRAQINFPWLTLGNGFANDVMLIQWYEFTGALGGTLWALVMNLAIFHLIKRWSAARSTKANRANPATSRFSLYRSSLSWVVALFLLPTLYSVIRYLTYEEKTDPYEMVILQPNIDPYMKFEYMPQEEQTAYLLRLADSLVTPNTEYIVGPETFINNNAWLESFDRNSEVVKMKQFLEAHPRAKIVMGATTYKLLTDPSEYTSNSRPLPGSDYMYNRYNSAFQLDTTDFIPVYHKSNLVVGVEFMPYTHMLGFLERLTVDLGGSFRGNSTQEYRETFESPQDGTRVAPVICWESIFGEYVTEYVSEAGAEFLFIITNDGWWRNTPGHRQHNSFARLRAIETRRSVARSANTGISSLIDQRGVELARIGWWKRSGLRGTLNKNDHLTFYVKHGDVVGRIAVFLTVILLLYALLIRYIRK